MFVPHISTPFLPISLSARVVGEVEEVPAASVMEEVTPESEALARALLEGRA